jgi:hypothetical protein
MRTRSEIRSRLKQASFRYLKAFLEKHLERVPQNCLHHDEVPIDPERGFGLGMCTVSDRSGSHVCDPRVPGCPSQGCKTFEHKRTKTDLKEDWSRMLKAAQSGGRRAELVRQGYGDLAALLWALDEELDEGDLGQELFESESESESESPMSCSECGAPLQGKEE